MNRKHDWTETHKAIDAVFEYEKSFDALVESLTRMPAVQADKAFQSWISKQAKLELRCGIAFCRATSYINGMDKARFADIESVIRLSEYKHSPVRNKHAKL